MARRLFILCGILLAAGGSLVSAAMQESDSPQASISPQRALINQYCVTCHNQKLRTANLLLDKADLDHIGDNAAIWEKVVHKLRTREMPPGGMPRPDNATYDSLATYLETELDRAAAARPNPGRPAIHRLNRLEYTNAIRDLVALNIDGATLLPSDDSGYGFDNIGDVLTVSPMLLERYLSAAGKISRLAVGDTAIGPTSTDYEVPHATVQRSRENDELPFGSRGGISIHHTFPVDAEYVIKVRLQRGKGGQILGINETRQVDVRLDGERIKLFTVGGRGKGGDSEYGEGDKSDEKADSGLEVRFPAKAGPHVVAVTFLKDTVKAEGLQNGERNLAFFEGVGTVSIAGPYNPTGPGDTPSRRKIFLCRPTGPKDEDACARKIVASLAHRAFRRPVSDEELPTLLVPYKTAKRKGGFETGIKMAVQRILVSPDFLFRVEIDPTKATPDTAIRVNDVELASRLSFFLWSSIPDDELLSVAERGKLRDPEVLQQQVKRMLADPRSKTLVTNFVGQWLYLRNIQRVLPDPVAFPDFDENLRQSLRTETEMFFQSMMQEDRSLLDLLRADYTFLNERLARHYGIPGIHGNEFRRVTLATDERKGLLGQGSILTVTSYANRTSPTLRGKWLLENILGSPPPPPPPNVPSLKDDPKGRVLTMRQRMEAHRANPACATCHSRMDPLGFALENFDGLGRWRTTTGNTPIDPSGTLPDGTKFEGPVGLRNILLSKQDQFVMTATERLLTYAMGRGVEPYDMPAVRKIVRDAVPGEYRWSSLIAGIVNSTPFQMRRAAEATTTAGRR